MKRAQEETLFDFAGKERMEKEKPLAARMRPMTLDEYVGQEHILAPGRLLRRAVQADQLSSLLFYGPPGTGKTTLASVIANTTRSFFVTLNAVMAGIADLRDVTASAQRRLNEYGQRTILFIDEVHRWNKAQQDALLPWVENGTVILIGATTENPYFTVNRALVSRSRIFQLKPLEERHIRQIILNALANEERGYGKLKVELADEALEHLANIANGDARAALNALELAVETTPADDEGVIHVTMSVAEESIQRRAVLYDREGDCHFDTISAFIKSMRGSDPDATFYWLAKMVYAGEDPRFIFRRMLIFCSEDIGMADPNALRVVISAAESFDRVGLPEGHYPLAHAALYCATAPKSNSVMGFFDALKNVENEREGEVPNHLRDASRDKEGFGHGVGYQYPHAYRDHWVAQQYLPGSLQGKIFYEPGSIGYEKQLAALVRSRRELQLSALKAAESELAPPEILSFAKEGRQDKWLARAVDNFSSQLATMREGIFSARRLQRHELVMDLTADTGELTLQAVRDVPEGGVWALTSSETSARSLSDLLENLSQLRRPFILKGRAEQLAGLMDTEESRDVRFDMMVGRYFLCRCPNRVERLRSVRPFLAPEGTLSLCELLPRRSQRLTELFPSTLSDVERALLKRCAEAEERMYEDEKDPRVNWDEHTLTKEFQEAGWKRPKIELSQLSRLQLLTRENLQHWFSPKEDSYGTALFAHGLRGEDVTAFRDLVANYLLNHKVTWHSYVAFLSVNYKNEN